MEELAPAARPALVDPPAVVPAVVDDPLAIRDAWPAGLESGTAVAPVSARCQPSG
jgi:hypothetical protein